ncbi:glycoside hydrolase family 16 protein [Rhodotorula toruloides]|uniref:BY PROTMAP: gi/472586173/gb/EMS23701.1/ glycoside hydrolase family 16 protein [Rhodosporidium toruloides NP11] gi/647397741/emb/CDR40977.1/ RHTO0S05e10176g1_1 [Rhodosporidium toruloides] n=1 Tax=Rhodotorula toruloides TaxID=5286 RepID=A0A0K3CP57_RHOTO|nr:glycoside hydrolase family 16 protein [Rhodotorula toruloides]PRQ71524.1 Concanavalin A-like lectin/glucanase domain-containing protein [Rhodotorula toruloides]
MEPSEMSSLPHRPPVFAPSFVTARTRSRSSSTSSVDSADSKTVKLDKGKGKLVDGAVSSSDWADHAAAPTLTYHQDPSVATLATGASEIYDYYASTDPVRKRFKAPFKAQLFDREVGNPKPWMKGRKTITRDKKSYFTTLFGILLGLGGGIALILYSVLNLEHDQYELLFSEDFDGDSLNSSRWKVEQRIGGGESNDFTWFTDHNSYVADGNLFIVPTLTNETMLSTDYALMNATYMQLGSACDSLHQSDCFIAADTEHNQTLVVPPVQSAMISTRGKVTMQYGRVVVHARMPTGDWLWPQISLVPEDEVYGGYPASGLISIFESRGNKAQHRLDQLNNEMICGLHWGPADAPAYDAFWRTQGLYKVYRNFFNQRYYTFGLDWTPQSITMWVNSRVRIAFRYGFGKKNFWELGSFGYSYGNGTIIANPWATAANQHVAPFDQAFYLRLAVLAGGTDGYWQDDLPNKPWRNSDARPQAMTRFANWANVWMPSWPSGDKIRDRGLAIDKIEVFQRVN